MMTQQIFHILLVLCTLSSPTLVQSLPLSEEPIACPPTGGGPGQFCALKDGYPGWFPCLDCAKSQFRTTMSECSKFQDRKCGKCLDTHREGPDGKCHSISQQDLPLLTSDDSKLTNVTSAMSDNQHHLDPGPEVKGLVIGLAVAIVCGLAIVALILYIQCYKKQFYMRMCDRLRPCKERPQSGPPRGSPDSVYAEINETKNPYSCSVQDAAFVLNNAASQQQSSSTPAQERNEFSIQVTSEEQEHLLAAATNTTTSAS